MLVSHLGLSLLNLLSSDDANKEVGCLSAIEPKKELDEEELTTLALAFLWLP